MDSQESLIKIFREGQEKFKKAQFVNAKRHFQYCLNRGYQVPIAKLYEAIYQYYMMQLPEAFISLQSIGATRGWAHSGIYYYLGAICDLLGNTVDACMYYRKTIDTMSDSLYPLRAYKALSVHEEDKAYRTKAMQTFQIQLQLSTGEKCILAAHQKYLLEDAKGAIDELIKAQNADKEYFEPILYLAEFYFSWGRWKEALHYWDILDRKFRLSFVDLLPQMQSFYHTKDYKKALSVWQLYKKLIRHPGAPQYFRLGLICSHLNRQSRAIWAYEQTTLWDPLFAPAFFNLGVSLQKRGDFSDALIAYDRVCVLSPDNAWAPYNMGMIYFEQKDYVRAHHYLSCALKIAPNFTEAEENIRYITALFMLGGDKGTFYHNHTLLIWFMVALFLILGALTLYHFVGGGIQ